MNKEKGRIIVNILQFLFGKNFEEKSLTVKPGTFYLDTEKKELWFDDPSATSSEHNKVIDTATLIYEVTETITFAGESDSGDNSDATNTAVLGVAVLGTMTLGTK